MKGKARVFGRVWEDERFHSLFVCSCGQTTWVMETEENIKEVQCCFCEKSHYLVKNNSGRYMVMKVK